MRVMAGALLKTDYPGTSVELSALKLAAIAFVIFLKSKQRTPGSFIAAIRWAVGAMDGPPDEWPIDLGRPVSEASEVIANHKAAALWWSEVADALEMICRSL
jgi:hypothetical protein